MPYITAITVIYGPIDDVMTADDIGKIIKYYRKQSGLSQKDIAKIAGIGKTSLFDMEKGKETVQLNTLLRVLEVLNIQMKFDTPFPQHNESEK